MRQIEVGGRSEVMVLDAFSEIIRHNEPLGPYTYLKLGGSAEMLAQPRTRAELSSLVQACTREKIAIRVLGSGCNLLVREERVPGLVLRLSEPEFCKVSVEGDRVRAGTGAPVSALISQAARNNLAGLETLIGIPGTVGGALRINAGDKSENIGQFVRSVEVIDDTGNTQIRERDELQFAEHATNLDDPVLLSVEFGLQPDSSDAIVKRMRKAWILRKAAQPLTYQSVGRIFKNPRGLNAAGLIERAGLVRTKVGGVEVSDRDPNYFVIHPGTTPKDVLRLMELVRSKVKEQYNISLENEITIW